MKANLKKNTSQIIIVNTLTIISPNWAAKVRIRSCLGQIIPKLKGKVESGRPFDAITIKIQPLDSNRRRIAAAASALSYISAGRCLLWRKQTVMATLVFSIYSFLDFINRLCIVFLCTL